ncbi:nicotinate-nucleotide adenylyltransferase [Alkalibaculum sp. M08DMB]|uniref:Probable nicotinate-nucleotide adenylyltransferase n=1 Tax=Alkalibaculum sporogenes TaxID=2655001 RepID=A0A6A7K912_9FIRM|nr:nicotinate-nucleotide adenylyltransferase [Alkalibaculum sporogenes]
MGGKDTKKIGILGGTFNPIHFGHLLLAESAKDRLGLDEIMFIPTGVNPHKFAEVNIDASHRLNMIELAIENNPFFSLSLIEINREGYTYTVDTIKELEQLYTETDIYFISGADIIFEIDKWKDAEEVLKKLKIVTTFRPGCDQEQLDNRITELKELYNTKILKLYTPEMDISSSEIRSRVKHGYSIKYLLPEKVEEYILDCGLYR